MYFQGRKTVLQQDYSRGIGTIRLVNPHADVPGGDDASCQRFVLKTEIISKFSDKSGRRVLIAIEEIDQILMALFGKRTFHRDGEK